MHGRRPRLSGASLFCTEVPIVILSARFREPVCDSRAT